jgi:NADH dehydrogenase
VAGAVKTGRVYELGGPETVTHREIVERVLRESLRNNPLIPVPRAIGKLMAAPFALLPFAPLLTGDQVDLLMTDNVVSAEAAREKRTLHAFGVSPTPMDAILPGYLWRFRKNGQFDRQPA